MSGYGGHALAVSPDGRTLATEGKFTRLDGKEARVEPTVMLWDTESGEVRKRVDPQPAAIECLAFSRDGRYLLTGTADAAFRLWDAETAEFVQALPPQEGGPTFAAFLPGERRLLTVTELPAPDRPDEDSMVNMVTGLVKQVRTVQDLRVSIWSYSD
jgi:WD40 repeat protein